jgi:hypothetical protein
MIATAVRGRAAVAAAAAAAAAAAERTGRMLMPGADELIDSILLFFFSLPN